MLTIRYTTTFKKDLKRIKKQADSGYDEAEFRYVLGELQNGRALEEKYHDHALVGNYKGVRECHLKPDLLLLYEINESVLELLLFRIGSHSEVFR